MSESVCDIRTGIASSPVGTGRTLYGLKCEVTTQNINCAN